MNVDLFIDGKWQRNKHPVVFTGRAQSGQTLYAAPVECTTESIGTGEFKRYAVGFDRFHKVYFVLILYWSELDKDQWSIWPLPHGEKLFRSLPDAIEYAISVNE